MSSVATAKSLLSGVEFDDPRLATLLRQLIDKIYALDSQINPPNVQSFGTTGQLIVPGGVTNFIATIFTNNIRLSWSSVIGINTYVIRYKSGSATILDWDNASTLLTTGTLSADINPLTIPLLYGDHSFLIKSLDATGTLSVIPAVVTINIPNISAPIVTSTVVDNNVLLKWTEPTSIFSIDHYNVYKDGAIQGTVSGTFEAIFEIIGGTYTYTIEAVDIVGNIGSLSGAVVVLVGNPNDFVLYDTLTSIFAGTKTNCAKEMLGSSLYLLACINIAETWTQHFVNNAWASIQAQITAGFDIYAEPALTTGSYVEVFDFGVIISNVIVVLAWNQTPIVGTVSVATSTIEVSTDNITYTSPATGTNLFASAVRYVRFTMNFVGSNSKSLAYFSNLQCLLNVHRESDGGTASAVSTDVGGTVVLFNKSFRSVESITVTAQSTTPVYTVVDFTPSLNPTSFKVLVFDTSGARVSRTINWQARGVI